MSRARLRSGARRRAAIVVVALLAACGGTGDGGDGSGAPSDSAAAGAQPDRPLLARGAVALEERLRIAGGRLESPIDLAVDGQGFVYVLDEAEATGLLRYDSTGAQVLAFGERESEESIGMGVAFDVAPWNTVLVVDRARNALRTYLTLGAFTSGLEIEPQLLLDVHALPEFGEFYLHAWNPDARTSSVTHMRLPNDSVGVAYSLGVPSGVSIREEARAVHYITAADRLGRLYVGFRDDYPIRIVSPQGATLATVDLERTPLRKTEAALAAEREANLAELRARAPDVVESILLEAAEPDSLVPIVEEMAVDPQGRLWVRTNRSDAVDRTPYDVFDEAGRLLARVDVPGDVRKTAFAPGGDLWVVSVSGGEPAVVRYGVRFGEAAPPAGPAGPERE